MIRALLLAVTLAGCHASSPEHAPATEAADHVGWTATVGAGEVILARLPGEVVHAPGGQLHLAPRVPLRIVRWQVRPGEPVQAGQALAMVQASMLDGLADEVAARRSVRDAAAARVRSGVGTQSDLSAAEAELSAVAAQWAATRGDLVRDGAGWSWRSPADGVVQAITCPPGEEVGPATSCIQLVNSEAPRVQVHVPEHLLPRLVQPSGRFVVAGRTEPVALSWVGDAPALHAASRTRTAWLTPSPDAQVDADTLLVGRSGRVDVLVPAPEGAVQVPARSLTRVDGRDVVFVQGGDQPVPVEVLARDGDQAVVIGALTAGQQVASRGVLLLKARLGLEEE